MLNNLQFIHNNIYILDASYYEDTIRKMNVLSRSQTAFLKVNHLNYIYSLLIIVLFLTGIYS